MRLLFLLGLLFLTIKLFLNSKSEKTDRTKITKITTESINNTEDLIDNDLEIEESVDFVLIPSGSRLLNIIVRDGQIVERSYIGPNKQIYRVKASQEKKIFSP